jgi:regulation of enolase protein 1 (concanavalin A-like superfamily)
MLVATAFWPSAGFAQDRSPQDLKGWGQKVDPGRDCQFRLDGDRLTIDVPATKHDLSAELGLVNAPRMLREIEGDFIAQVKISGNVAHRGASTVSQRLGYHGAGLLLWIDERNYVRLERAAIERQGEVVHYGNFDVRQNGRLAGSKSVKLPDQDITVRLERRGGQVLGAVSHDGLHWYYFDPITISPMPRRIKLGIAAINTSTERFKATYVGREIYKKETN